MALKYSGKKHELCYPFIYEDSPLCDYEILTDELCALIGAVISELESSPELEDIYQSLERLQPKIFHLNGSIRGRQGIFEEDIAELTHSYQTYHKETQGVIKGFILPRGGRAVQRLHACRSLAKKVIRQLVIIDREGIEMAETLHRFSNLLVNYFFLLTVVINKREGRKEVEYASINYG